MLSPCSFSEIRHIVANAASTTINETVNAKRAVRRRKKGTQSLLVPTAIFRSVSKLVVEEVSFAPV